MNRLIETERIKVIYLILTLGALFWAGQLFYEKFGYFLLEASYENFQLWYPRYYNVAYIMLWMVRCCLVLSAAFAAWSVRSWIIASWKFVKASYHFFRISKSEIIEGKDEERKYSAQYVSLFWIFQAVVFFIGILAYYFIIHFSDTAQQFQLQRQISILILCVWTLATLCFIVKNHEFCIFYLVKFLFHPQLPYNIALYRIVFSITLLITYLIAAFHHILFIESKPREPLPFIGWLIDIMPLSKEMFFTASIIGMVSSVFLALGLFTRLFLFLNAVLIFYVVSAPNFYGKVWHSQLPIWISWILLFAPISDVFSLDKYFFKKNAPIVKSCAYNFPIKMIWLHFGLIYFWAGFYKLYDAGLEWALGNNMINQVRLEWFEHFNRAPFWRVDRHPWLLHMGGLAVILFELIYWYLLFLPRLRFVSIWGGLLMHNLIGAFMYIFFPELQLQYIVFINYEKIMMKLKARFSSVSIDLNPRHAKSGISKKLVYFSFFVFGMNFLFGMFKITSFPFSVYPTYSELTVNTKEYLHFELADNDMRHINVRELAKKHNFRWENFSRTDYAIINHYRKTGFIDTLLIYKQWSWWRNELQELKHADTIHVYINKTSLNPDSAHILLKNEFLTTLYLNVKQ